MKTKRIAILFICLLIFSTLAAVSCKKETKPEGPKLNETSISVEEGKTAQLFVTDGIAEAWVSDNVSVATVSKSGLVEGVREGTATITAYVGEEALSCKVAVTPYKMTEAANLWIDYKAAKLYTDYELTLTANITVGSENTVISSSKIEWTSDNPMVATVSSEGIVKGIKKGTAQISAKYDYNGKKYTATCLLSVIADAKLEFDCSDLKLAVDDNYSVGTLTKIYYERTDGQYLEETAPQNLVWQSSDTNIATVDNNGNVTALHGGTVVISLSNDDVKAECTVTVYDKVITSVADFESIETDLAANYILANDIDFGNKNYSGWSVVSSGDSNFTGIIDGNGYSVKNITFSAGMRGIFVNMSGTLKNISFKNITVTKGDSNRGGIIAHTAKGGHFENIYIQAVVTRSVPGFGGYVAPIVYDPKVADNTAEPTVIKNCVVSLLGSTANVCGQFIGNAGAANCAVLENCYAVDTNEAWLAGSLQRVTGWDTCVRSNDIGNLYVLSENFKNLDETIWRKDSTKTNLPELIQKSL